MFEVGDLVKGKSGSPYKITNEHMTKGVVRSVDGSEMRVRVVEHECGGSGCFLVEKSYFEKIGHLDEFDRDKFLYELSKGKDEAVKYLISTNLRRANLSGAEGMLDAINYLEANFERTDEGYIVYKTFGSNYYAPDRWTIEAGEIITEICNPDRTCEFGCGINVAPYQLVHRNYNGDIYKLLIRFEWLAGVIVPFGTNGKIRCSRAQIVGKVE